MDIEKKRFMELLPYVNRAFAYLEQQEFSGRVSRSKTYRRKAFDEADALMGDEYLWNQELVQDEMEKAQILETLRTLSSEELSLIYRVVDGYPFTCECDDTFMECYCRLNEKGRALFREALDVEQREMGISYHDEFCDFCRKMSVENPTFTQDITPEVLYGKMESVKYSFYPEDAENLIKYRHAEPGTWETLELYHKLIFSYPEGNIEGMTFSETDSLLIFLYRLAGIPSLCIQNENSKEEQIQ